MLRLPLAAALLALIVAPFGCGTTDPAASPGDITDGQRDGARNAVELMRGRYGLRVSGTGMSARLSLARNGRVPIIILNGSRSSVQELALISAEAVTDVEVLTSMADTMVYGQDAALSGVVRVEANVGLDG